MKLQYIIVMALITGGLTSPWFKSKGEGFLHSIKTHAENEHLGAVTAECKAAMFPDFGALEAKHMDLTAQDTDDGATQFFFEVYFNQDLTPCNRPDSGLKTKIFVANTDHYDVETPAPEGRNMRDYYGDGGEFLEEDGDEWKELHVTCNEGYFCGDPDTDLNWSGVSTVEKLAEGVTYKTQLWFLQEQLMELAADDFLQNVEVYTPGDETGIANSEEMYVPMSMVWYLDSYGFFETVAFMSFDFKIIIFTSVTPGRTEKIQIQAREIKADPCEHCEVSIKASASAWFVYSKDGAEPDDWSVLKPDAVYDAFAPCYVKFTLKNPEEWAGRAIQLIQLDWSDMRNPLAQYKMWDSLAGSTNDRFEVNILDLWNPDEGEVRIGIPALEAGVGSQIVFIGQFMLMSVDDDGNFEVLDKSEIPTEDGGSADYYMQTRRLQDEDVTPIVQTYQTDTQLAGGETGGDTDEDDGGWFSGISGFYMSQSKKTKTKESKWYNVQTEAMLGTSNEESHTMYYVAGGAIGAFVVLAGVLVATKKFYSNRPVQYQRLYEA